MSGIIDVWGRPAPGSLLRSIRIGKTGIYRVSRRDCELYSVMITSSGAWGRAKLFDADGNDIWLQPSAFTGSFVLMAGAFGGLLASIYSADLFAPWLTINWRERDRKIV